METTLRDVVRRRTGERCEYCRLTQAHLPFSTFHVEHIIYNAHKGANLTGIDPDTGDIVPLFNPRVHVWEDHFVLSGVTMVGLTAMGRTTVRVLNMNDTRRLRLRAMLARHAQL